MSITLQSLLTPEKIVEVDYPGYEGFKLSIAFLSREEIMKLRKKCTVTKFDKKSRQPYDELDDDLFLKTFVGAVIKGWTGLKYKYLQEFLLVDLSSVPNPEDELAFNLENAVVLMKNSGEIDSFVSEITNDLSNFTKYSSRN